MGVGTGVWLVHWIAGFESFAEPVLGDVLPLPVALTTSGVALVTYFIVDRGPLPETTEAESTAPQ